MRGLSYLICSLWSCVIRIQSSASFFLFLFTYLSQHKYILRKIEDIKNKVKWEICIISDKLGYKIGSFSVSLCVSPYLFPSISLCVSPPLSVSPFLSFFLCLPLSLSLSVSLSLSHHWQKSTEHELALTHIDFPLHRFLKCSVDPCQAISSLAEHAYHLPICPHLDLRCPYDELNKDIIFPTGVTGPKPHCPWCDS